MRMPSHAALCSFFFSALLTSAFVPSNGDVALASAGAPGVEMAVQSALNGLRAQGFAGSTQAALPSPAATPAAAPAFSAAGGAPTQGFMDKMTRLILTKGVDKGVNVSFVNALGLTPSGQDWADHQIGAEADKINHSFAISRGTDQDLVVFVRRTDGIIYIFRASRDGKSLAALSFNLQTRMITMRDAAAVQQELDDEFSFWTRNVDKLLAGA